MINSIFFYEKKEKAFLSLIYIMKGGDDIQTKEKLIPLSSDICFRTIFKKKKNLKYFLEDILEEEIKEIEYQDRVIEAEEVEKKECRLDMVIKLGNDTIVNIEMQKDKTGDIFKRTNYYISRIMSKSLKRGESYNKLPKALAIWIIDYKEKEIKKYKSDLKLCDTKAIERIRKGNNKEEILIKDEIRIIIIDLTKEADKSKIAEWKEIFRSGEVMNKRDKRLQEVVEEIKRLSQNKEAMELYRLEQDIEIEKISREEYIKETAKEEGIIQGKEEGITLAKKSAAKNFYKNNVSKDIICQSLEITKEELENILKEC